MRLFALKKNFFLVIDCLIGVFINVLCNCYLTHIYIIIIECLHFPSFLSLSDFSKKKKYLRLSHLGDLITSSEKFLVYYYYYYFFNILICLLPILLRSITLIISIIIVVVVSFIQFICSCIFSLLL